MKLIFLRSNVLILSMLSLCLNAASDTSKKSTKKLVNSCTQLKVALDQARGGNFQRVFRIPLSFEQELVQQGNVFVPRPASDKPHSVFGRAKFTFARDLSSVDFEIFIFNAQGRLNINERITAAHLHAAAANQNGPIIATLRQVVPPPFSQAGIRVNGLFARGTLTNADIQEVTSPNGYTFNSIASLLEGIRRGEVYVNAHGSSADPSKPVYPEGIVRGQIFGSAITF